MHKKNEGAPDINMNVNIWGIESRYFSKLQYFLN